MLRTSLLCAITASIALPPLTAATDRKMEGRTVVLGSAQIHPPLEDVIDVPMPPRDAFEPSVVPHPRPPLAPGRGTGPRPDSPESTIGQLDLAPPAPCSLKGHLNAAVRPAGAVLHTVGEPAAAFLGTTMADADTAFYSANRFGARSDDGGQSWTHIDPYTRFPNLDGGFCCDQRTLYVPSRDITIWQLLYLPNAQMGSIRIAVSVGRDGLRNDEWHSYVVNPQQFGFPVGYWFDYPDFSCSDNHLYFAINVVTPTPWTNVDTVIMKFPLDELRDGVQLNTTFWTRTQTLGPSSQFRLAQGSTHTMYIGAHLDSTTLRTLQNEDSSSTITFQDQTVAAWESDNYVSLLSNGSNWAARAGTWVDGAYANDEEYGFLWTAASAPGRPLPYLRIAKFRTADDTLIEEEEIWSSSNAYMYGTATTNAAGDVGCVAAVGGASLKPVSTILIVDDCRPTFSGGPIFGWAFSTHNPAFEGWGDYFSMQRHPVRSLGFVASGMSMQGGTQHTDQEPRVLHVGRERDELSWTSVVITSPGVTGVPITVRPTDELGKSGVVTPGYVSYLPDASAGPIPGGVAAGGSHTPLPPIHRTYELTAPASHNAGGSNYAFERWRHRRSPIGPWSTLPAGQRTLNLPSIGPTDQTAEAIYVEL